VILFIALSRLIDMITGVNSEILSNSKHYKVNFYLTAGLIAVTAGTNLLFIPMYGVTGAAMATAISLLLLNLLKWFYIKVRFNMQPFGFGVVKGILVIFASLAISQLLPFVHSVWMDLIVRSAVCGLAFVGLTYFTRVSDEANDFIEKTVSRSLGMIRRK
jgi:O-antigen/teichoic acid export membrane protein